MSLATRCPNCDTLFKVTSGQLQLHEGKVRCGQCQTVFSGIEYLTSPDTEAWQKLDLSPKPFANGSSTTNDEQSDQAELFGRTPSSKGRLEFSKGSRSLKVACVLLLATLGLQAAWWQRLNLLEHAPGLAQQLDNAVPAVQKLFSRPATAALVVEGSGLQALDENNMRMDLTLHNSRKLPTAWPFLKVDLLDSQGLVLASKSLTPADYQVRKGPDKDSNEMIPAGNTVEILAFLNLSALNRQLPESAATGFRLELFDLGRTEQP